MGRGKIYCKNCKRLLETGIHGPLCILEKYYTIDYYGRKQKNLKTDSKICKFKNENNDCKDYKRKWWKFWIKERENQTNK